MRPCPVPRRLSLSLDKNLRAKEGGKEKTGKTALNLAFFAFPMDPCASSPVARVLRWPLWKTMRKTKRLGRRLNETFITLGSKCCYRWDLYRNFCSFYFKVTTQVPHIVLQQSKKGQSFIFKMYCRLRNQVVNTFHETDSRSAPFGQFLLCQFELSL